METAIHLRLDNVWQFLMPDFLAKTGVYDKTIGEAFPKIIPPWEHTTAEFNYLKKGHHLQHRVVATLFEASIQAPGLRWFLETIYSTSLNSSPSYEYFRALYPIDNKGSWATDESAWERERVLREIGGDLLLYPTDDQTGCPGLGLRIDKANSGIQKIADREAISPGEAAASLAIGPAWTFFFAINLAHCKNVALADTPEPRAERRRKQRDGIPSITWKTLVIEPITRHASVTAQPPGEERIRQALHIARGHFKTFDEKPLFGRIKGTFWWNQQLRGSADRGAVIKDYDVQPQ